MLARKLKRAACLPVGMAVLLGPGRALADYALNLQEPASPVARMIFDLHSTVFWIVMVVGAIVFGGTGYALFKFRKSKGAQSADFHEHLGVEITWTVLPFLVLFAIAVPATNTLIAMHDTSEADLTIKVTGYQWKWKYDYLDEGIGFVSKTSTPQDQIYGKAPKGEHYLLEVDNPVVIPVNKKVRFLTTSNDVLHSWAVPKFGVKKDAVPGFINETWAKVEKTGTYRGQCSELCGKDHGFMPIVVNVVTEPEYRAWVTAQKAAKTAQSKQADRRWGKAELVAKGGEVYAENCLMCHGENGEGNPDLMAPALKGSKIALGPVADHIKRVMFGIEGTAMAAYNELLSDLEMAAVITYERNSWGNNVGDLVQPSTIRAAR